MTVKLFSEITHVILKSYNHTCYNTCKASHWLAYLPSLIFVLLRLLIATKMVSAFADTTFTIETDTAFNFEINDKCQTDGRGRQHNHNMNNTATRNIHGG